MKALLHSSLIALLSLLGTDSAFAEFIVSASEGAAAFAPVTDTSETPRPAVSGHPHSRPQPSTPHTEPVLALNVGPGPVAPPAPDQPAAFFILYDTSASMAGKAVDENGQEWPRAKIEEVNAQLADLCLSLPFESHVQLYTFDKQLVRGPAVSIQKNFDRQLLHDFFHSRKAEGRKTYLWTSLDAVLVDAGKYARDHAGRAVKVLVYTDGEDNQDKGPGMIRVLNQHRELIEDRAQLTYVALDYTLRAEVKEVLEQHGVNVTNATSPLDVIPLTPAFSVFPPEPLVGETVIIRDHSTGIIRDAKMDLGDGSPVTHERSPRHVFGTAGDYTLTLTLTDHRGKSTSTSRTIRVKEPAPVRPAFRFATDNVTPGTPVAIINETDGTDLTFTWLLDNGRTATQRHLVVTPDEVGDLNVVLRVRDRWGRDFETTRSLTVVPRTYVAPKVTVHGPQTTEIGHTVHLTAVTEGRCTDFSWTIDGEPLRHRGASITWLCEAAGKHEFACTVNGPGGRATADHIIEAAALVPPAAGFRVATDTNAGNKPFTVRTNEPVRFINTSTGESFQWDFGDGTTSNEQEPEHVFSTLGTYTVVQTAEGPGGQSTHSLTIEVVAPPAPPAPVARMTVGADTIRAGESMRLSDQSIGPVTSATWEVTGHEPVTVDYERADAPRFITVSFDKATVQTATLTVEGPGGTDTVQRTIDVGARFAEPTGTLHADVTDGREALTVTFTCEFGGTVDRLTLDFGDGSELVEWDGLSPISHEYVPGTWNPVLTVEGLDEFAPARDASVTITVAEPLPAWARNLHWIILASVVSLAAAGGTMWSVVRYLRNRGRGLLTGILQFRPRQPGSSWVDEALDGAGREYAFALSDDMRGVIRSHWDKTSDQVSYELDIFKDGVVINTLHLEDGQRVRGSGFEFLHSA